MATDKRRRRAGSETPRRQTRSDTSTPRAKEPAGAKASAVRDEKTPVAEATPSPVRHAKDVIAAAKPSPVRAAKRPGASPARLAPSVSLSTLAGRAARFALRRMLEKAAPVAEVREGAGRLREVAQATGATGGEMIRAGLAPRLPIQISLDVAVPIAFAWSQWEELEFLPEGIHAATEITRSGDRLTGVTGGTRGTRWEAEVLDERDQESFAWRSETGSDCAGLVTFHRLGERLTRLECNLDVRPLSAADAVVLSTHLAHRRAEQELRRFKARLELVSPDVYETAGEPAGETDG